jgi:hypothetical protein
MRLKTRCQKGCIPSGDSREEFTSLPYFSFFRRYLPPLTWDPFLYLQSTSFQPLILSSYLLLMTLSFLSSYKGSCEYDKLIQVMKYLWILHVQSLLAKAYIIMGFGLGYGHIFGGGLIIQIITLRNRSPIQSLCVGFVSPSRRAVFR